MTTEFSIDFKGQTYPFNNFSKIYFQGLVECLSKNRISNVSYLSNSAHIIKKIALPSVADEVIAESEVDNDLYLWQIEPQEIAELILKIAATWLQFNISLNKSDPVEIATYQKQLSMCMEAIAKIESVQSSSKLIVDISSSEKDKEIAKLKAQLESLK